MIHYSEKWTSTALLVGQAPGPTTEDVPLTGDAGKRLCEMMFVKYPSFSELFDRVSLLSKHPGGKFPIKEARRRARLISDCEFDGYTHVLFLGRNVTRAFGLAKMPWLTWTLIPEMGEANFAAVPNPSGRCRSYNDPVFYQDALLFLRQFTTTVSMELTDYVEARSSR